MTVAGLYLKIGPKGAKSWLFRYELGGSGPRCTISRQCHRKGVGLGIEGFEADTLSASNFDVRRIAAHCRLCSRPRCKHHDVGPPECSS